MTLYVFDIDGTLANINHRRHFVATKPKNWVAFEKTMDRDTLVAEIAELNRTLYSSGATIIICTGRGEQNREVTEKWLAANQIQYHTMFMRPEKNYERDDIIKGRMADHIETTFGKISMVFDDRNQVVDMWRERDIVCAQVAPGDF
jgi:hypothetical protein